MIIPSRTLIVGCGYLGRRVAAKLLHQGDYVYGTTRSGAKMEALTRIGVHPLMLDVTQPSPFGAIPHVDRVLHCVGFDRQQGHSVESVYVDGFRHLLDSFHGFSGRIVHVGSTGVYGETEGEWVREESTPTPKTVSGEACLRAEQLVSSSGYNYSIVRFSGLYGPARIIGKVGLIRGDPITSDPKGWLNLIEIDDAAEAAIAVLDRGRPGRIYLATDDRPVIRREYYERVAELCETPPPRFSERDSAAPDKSNKRVSNRRIREELGWNPRSPDFRSGLEKAIREEIG